MDDFEVEVNLRRQTLLANQLINDEYEVDSDKAIELAELVVTLNKTMTAKKIAENLSTRKIVNAHSLLYKIVFELLCLPSDITINSLLVTLLDNDGGYEFGLLQAMDYLLRDIHRDERGDWSTADDVIVDVREKS